MRPSRIVFPDGSDDEDVIDANGVDLTVIRACLAMTPIERAQANDAFVAGILYIRSRNPQLHVAEEVIQPWSDTKSEVSAG